MLVTDSVYLALNEWKIRGCIMYNPQLFAKKKKENENLCSLRIDIFVSSSREQSVCTAIFFNSEEATKVASEYFQGDVVEIVDTPKPDFYKDKEGQIVLKQVIIPKSIQKIGHLDIYNTKTKIEFL